MERVTAVVVLVLGALVLLMTAYSVALGEGAPTLVKVALLLIVLVAMYRAAGHLQRRSGSAPRR